MHTSDIYLCSAMLALGANLVHVDRTDPRHMQFEILSKSDISGYPASETPNLDLSGVETDWLNGSLMVNATQYADALKRMKATVHSKD